MQRPPFVAIRLPGLMLLLALFAQALVAVPCGAGEKQADELIAKARLAFSRPRPELLRKIVREDRAAAFEAVDRLAGENDASSLRLAEAIAEAYAEVFADRRPLDRLPYFRSLSDEQRTLRAHGLALKNDGKQAHADGRLESTLEAFRAACAIFERIGDARQTAWCAMAIAGVEGESGPSENTLRDLEAAREGLERVGDLRALCALENNIAVIASQGGDLATAVESSERAVRSAHALGDRSEEAGLLANLGFFLSEQGELERAVEAEREAATIAAEIGEAQTEAMARSSLGKLLRERGDMPSATVELRRAVAAAHRAGAGWIEGDAAASLAIALQEQGQGAQARVWLERAAALAAASDSATLRAQVACARSSSLVGEGRALEALPILDVSIQEVEKGSDAGMLATVLECRATALYSLGRYDEAVTVQEASIAAAVRSGDAQVEAWRRNLLGAFLAVLGNFTEAQRELETAVRLHAQARNELGRCRALERLGFVHERTGDRAAARRDLESAIQCSTETGQISDRAAALIDMARLELEAGRSGVRAAVERLTEAAELGRKSNDTAGTTESELLTAHAQLLAGDLPAAKAALSRVAPLGRHKRTAYNEWRYQYLRARIASREGDRGLAIRRCERAVHEVEHLRSGVQRPLFRAAILDDRIEPYRELVSLDLEVGAVESAYRIARLAKARAFAEKLVPRSVEGEESASLEAPGWETTIAPVSRLRSLLREHEALLDFFIARDGLVVFVLKREGIRARRLPESLASLRQLASVARFPGRPEASDAALTEAWRLATSRLGSALLDPLAADLAGVDELLVAPNGWLHSVPFAALPFDGALLVEKRSVAVLPVAEALFSRRAPGGSVNGLLALGDPEIEERGSRLPGAELEIRRVASLAEGPVFAGSGGDASEAAYRLRAPSSQYIHLAAHGRVDRIAPQRSRVELASGGGEDGSLTAEEVAASRVGASLVVLSGCETAREAAIALDEAPGDEREGLVRAFLKAGAGTVVASLWELSDSVSSEIFPEIYRTIPGGLGPATALNQIQREMMHGTLRGSDGLLLDHPFYWAGIVAYGAGR